MSNPTVWKAAQACIDAQGENAEAELRRLAQLALDADNVDEGVALFEVYQAVKHLRGVAELGDGSAH